MWATPTGFVARLSVLSIEANKRKLVKDWERKIVLPEAREAFATRRAMHQELAGKLPEKYLI